MRAIRGKRLGANSRDLVRRQGIALRYARDDALLTQTEVAQAMGYRHAVEVQAWESGKLVMALDTIQKLSVMLDTPAQDLVRGDYHAESSLSPKQRVLVLTPIIRHRMGIMGYTQKRLADKARVSTLTVSQMLTGCDGHLPSAHTIRAILGALDIPLRVYRDDAFRSGYVREMLRDAQLMKGRTDV